MILRWYDHSLFPRKKEIKIIRRIRTTTVINRYIDMVKLQRKDSCSNNLDVVKVMTLNNFQKILAVAHY